MIRLAVLLLVACTSSAHPAARTKLPDEVTRFVERWEMCWHFSGEEPYSEARKKDIGDGIAEWCPGNDLERARLTAKWQGDVAVQDALRKLDDMR